MTERELPPSERPTIPAPPSFTGEVEKEQQIEFFCRRLRGRTHTVKRWVPARPTTPCPPPLSSAQPLVSIPAPPPLPACDDDEWLEVEVDYAVESIRTAEAIVDDAIPPTQRTGGAA